jgi:hypothetical protein
MKLTKKQIKVTYRYVLDKAKKKVIPLRIKNVQPPLMLANLQYVDFYRKNYEKTLEEL